MKNYYKNLALITVILALLANFSDDVSVILFLTSALFTLIPPFRLSKLKDNVERVNVMYLRRIFLNTSLLYVVYVIFFTIVVSICAGLLKLVGVDTSFILDSPVTDTMSMVNTVTSKVMTVWVIFAYVNLLKATKENRVASIKMLRFAEKKYGKDEVSANFDDNYIEQARMISLGYSFLLSFPLFGLVVSYFINPINQEIKNQKEFLKAKNLKVFLLQLSLLVAILVGITMAYLGGFSVDAKNRDLLNSGYGIASLTIGILSNLGVLIVIFIQIKSFYKGVKSFVSTDTL